MKGGGTMRKRIGDKGFSLVEIMVGVTILAIIIIPLLHAFLTSQKSTNKASEIRNQTMAAQNILETYGATDIGALIAAVKNGAAPMGGLAAGATVYAYNSETGGYSLVTDSSTEAEYGPGYKVYLTGVGGGTKTYDAVLELDASKYADRNSDQIVDYKPMDAVVPQPADADGNPDMIAARTFASHATIDSGSEFSPDYFLNIMNRTITITIQRLGGETGSVSATAKFHYDTQYPVPDPTSERAPPIMVQDWTDVPPLCSGNSTARENGEYGMYFFYYPNCKSMSDTIMVVNEENINISVYLIRQSADDSGYSPSISLRETYVSGKKWPYEPVTQLHYNNVTMPQYPYTYYEGKRSGETWLDRRHTTDWFDGILVDTKMQNHMYDVRVDIYKDKTLDGAGADFTGTPLSSFDASSLEWKNGNG
jgi:prepilin-type N-terminal cleavage/methylation domain-containing protein